MERNKLMYEAFSVLGPLAFGAYLKELPVKLTQDELKEIIVCCLPKNYEAKFPPLLNKFAQFVGKKAFHLFPLKARNDHTSSSIDNEDIFLPTPPFESYLNIGKAERLALFFRSVRKYDIIVAKIAKREENRYYGEIVCFANRKHRVIDDLHYHVVLDCDTDIQIGSLVRATIIKSCLTERQLFISIDDKDLPAWSNPGSLKLGIITEDELPLYYRMMKEKSNTSCSKLLQDCMPKTHDCCVKMLNHFNSDPYDIPSYTQFASEFTFSPEKTASAIYKKQMSDLSTFKYRQGMDFYIKSQKAESLKCFNESLKLNPKNEAALLSIGAIFWNSKNYKKAIETFEKVLELNDSCERAMQFLCTSLEKLIQSSDETDYLEIFRSGVKMMKYNFKPDFAEKYIMKTMFQTEYLDEFGPPWFKGGNYVKVVEDYPSSGSDMEVEETEDGRIEVLPEEQNEAPEVTIKQENTDAANSQAGEKTETKSSSKADQDIAKEESSETQKLKSVAIGSDNKSNLVGNESTPGSKPEVSVKEEAPKTSDTDLHKIKCDEFISSNLKKRSVSRHSTESRSVRKEKHSSRRRHSHGKRRRHKKKKHRNRRHSRSSSSQKEEAESDCLSDISSGSVIYERTKESYGPSPPPSSRSFQHDVRRRSHSRERSRSRSRTVRLRTRKRSSSSEGEVRSRSRSRHSKSHSPIRYPDDYSSSLLARASTSNFLSYPCPPVARVPIEPMSRPPPYQNATKDDAVQILENILTGVRK